MEYTHEEVRALMAESLKEVREELRINQTELADRMDLSRAAVWSAESPGSGLTSIATLMQYEKALGVPRGTLLMRAGIIDSLVSTTEAIRRDETLTDPQRHFLLSAYAMAKSSSAQ